MARLLTIPEAARLTARNPELLRRLIREGRLRATRDDAGVYLIAPDDLAALLDLRRSPTAA